jgi:hypothetical protein
LNFWLISAAFTNGGRKDKGKYSGYYNDYYSLLTIKNYEKDFIIFLPTRTWHFDELRKGRCRIYYF